MIVRKENCRREIIEHMKGGEGHFDLIHLADADILGQAGRLFGCGTLAPGHSVGWHVHEKDIEICWVLSGQGKAVENDGTVHEIGAGDIQICQLGCGHEIINTGSEPLVYTVLICYPQGL